jgi:ATP-binding cassette subfamily B protein
MLVPARQALRRLLPYYHPYRIQVALGLISVVAAAALANIIPSILQRGVDTMRSGADSITLWRLGGVMLITAVVSGGLRFFMRQSLNGVSRRIETDLRHDVYARLTTLDANWYARWRTGDLMARLTNDLSAVRMATGPAIMYLVNTVAGGLFALVMMVRISPLLTALALLPMAGLPILMLRLGRRVHARFEAVQSQFSDLSSRAQENLAGVRVVRAYRQEVAESRRFEALGDAYLEANIRLAKLNGLMNPGFALLAGLGGAVTIAVGGRLLIAGQITVGGYVAFGIYLTMLTWPLIALGWTTNLLQRGAASMARVLELLDAAPDDVQDRGQSAIPEGVTHKDGRAIEFRHVWFHYPDASANRASEPPADAPVPATEPRWVLRDVSFVVPAGGTLAIVGATGAGKSALMDLIPRLFDPQRGDILVDGVSLRELPLSALRGEIGYVPQESLLFSDTIGANVAYGLSPSDEDDRGADHTRSDRAAAVAQAVDIAQLRETITGLPDGLDTRLGERGINLSGGQKQRTALARALARRPRIVLLDDALSAVDTHTEAAILDGLRGALTGRTAIIASHRISAVRDADHIVVLDDGAIVEQGHHDDLVRRNGRYAQLLRRQQLLDAIEAA